MSHLKIEADIASTEITFLYTGAEIEGPLRHLFGYLLERAAETEKKLPAESRGMPRPGDLCKPGNEAELRHKIQVDRKSAFEALLFADEAKRTPAATWRLTQAKLEWIYQMKKPA